MRYGVFIFGNTKFSVVGFSLIVISYAMYFFDPVEIIKTAKLTFVEGSYIYRVWQKPPVKVFINVHMFNITNHERFLAGQDEKIRVEEVGPYVYWEELEHTNVTFNDNGTITYIPRRTLHFDRSLSVSDPKTDRIFVANLPLLGFSTVLRNGPKVVNMMFDSLVHMIDSQPILELTANDFLWGYDDQLVKLANQVLPNWIDFPRFGLLDRMLNEGTNVVTMVLPSEKHTQRSYSIDNFNGSPILPQWVDKNHPDEPNKCTLEEAMEGVVFPRHLTPDMHFPMYRKAFCRTLPLKYTSAGDTKNGYPVHFYKFPMDAFNSSLEQNKCYCQDGDCLPAGLSDLSPCYYNIPVAVSFPHFYGGDPSLVDNVEGISPVKEEHESLVAIQPDIGIPLEANLKVQINLVVKTTDAIERVMKFDGMVMPIFWLHMEIKSLPDSLNNLLFLCFFVGPILVKVVIALLASAGVALIVLPTVRSWVGKNKGIASALCCCVRRPHGHRLRTPQDLEHGGDHCGGGCVGRDGSCADACRLVLAADDSKAKESCGAGKTGPIILTAPTIVKVKSGKSKKSTGAAQYSPLGVIVPKTIFEPDGDDARSR
ncbi:scavenger receptor class B member 1-like isoform X2 [Adelges cooleyi]|uniref:scavenger receptor class B member 1-like isoform X2 n=1 Tax=Adelges cooleyi TaxID=133065 RepID=UPI00217FA2EB|nr:scavenger receptor class B member 1-like isoform X2 [Adelges cooleyi]